MRMCDGLKLIISDVMVETNFATLSMSEAEAEVEAVAEESTESAERVPRVPHRGTKVVPRRGRCDGKLFYVL